jgi:hypothetical protein
LLPLDQLTAEQRLMRRGCLSLCWAVLDLFLAGARGLGLSDLEYRQVVQMKMARLQQADELTRIA